MQNKLHWAVTGQTAAELIAQRASFAMYLDYAEEQARRRRMLYMRDWREKLDAFLAFNERDVLKDAGKVSAEVAQRLALDEFEKFDQARMVADIWPGSANPMRFKVRTVSGSSSTPVKIRLPKRDDRASSPAKSSP